MLRTAAGLFRAQGYHATGLNQVLAEGSLPKGSLYFHFPGGKEQLAVESLQRSGEELCAGIAGMLAATADPAEAVDRVLALLGEHLVATDFREGCPVASVALDAAARSEPIRIACTDVYDSWERLVAQHLCTVGPPTPTGSPPCSWPPWKAPCCSPARAGTSRPCRPWGRTCAPCSHRNGDRYEDPPPELRHDAPLRRPPGERDRPGAHHRYPRAQWAHGPRWVTHAPQGDEWFGFAAVRPDGARARAPAGQPGTAARAGARARGPDHGVQRPRPGGAADPAAPPGGRLASAVTPRQAALGSIRTNPVWVSTHE